ncbi:MAG: hypothetical protein GQ547_05830 [Methylophaga sp.]|nr:hypothetical protein [Methylophaga sp.]
MNIKVWAKGLIGGVLAAVVIYGFIIFCIVESTINETAAFGDSFGALTSLFSGLAFSGLILTILLQREDLNLQRQELSETRNEMKLQNFETTFFQMLRLHNSIVESIDIRKRSGEKGQVAVIPPLLMEINRRTFSLC